MNPTLVMGLLRQRLSSPVRMAILGLMVAIPPAIMAAFPAIGLSPLGDGFPLGLVFAIGMIGQDVSSGVLQLTFARPVRRWEYVISRWLGAALGASVVNLIQVGLSWAVLAARGHSPEATVVTTALLGREFEIVGVIAVIALFSSLMNGIGDLALYVILSILGGTLSMVGQFGSMRPASWIGQELGILLAPRLELAQILAGTPSWFGILTYASNLALCLTLAIVMVNRKELSYASG